MAAGVRPGSALEDVLWASGPARFDGSKIRLREPHPNLPELFTQFNRLFFGSSLDCVNVEWSKRMTLCAGQTQFSRTFCVVKLSAPLLALRPESDLIDTLLHEQIHAWLWTQRVFEREDNGHGPRFKAKMRELNAKYGTTVSPYHDWHAEVDSFRGHWWQCSGPCRRRPPRFGIVKRAMNRAPGPHDSWWSTHAASCGGTYTKIREPEGYGKRKRKRTQVAATPTRRTLDGFVVRGGGGKSAWADAAAPKAEPGEAASSSASASASAAPATTDDGWPFTGLADGEVLVLDAPSDDESDVVSLTDSEDEGAGLQEGGGRPKLASADAPDAAAALGSGAGASPGLPAEESVVVLDGASPGLPLPRRRRPDAGVVGSGAVIDLCTDID